MEAPAKRRAERRPAMNAKKDEGPKTLGGYVVMVLGAVVLLLLLVFGLLSSGRPI